MGVLRSDSWVRLRVDAGRPHQERHPPRGTALTVPMAHRSEVSHGELVTVAFVDRKQLRDLTVCGITEIVQIFRLEGVLTEDHCSRLQPGFDQFEHWQVKGECAVDQQ
jgi:hypothetical protein